MEKNLIMFNSMTSAMRCKELLSRHGVASRVIRTPANLRRKSCGHSLLVKKDFKKAMEIIKKHDVKILGVAAADVS